MIFGLTGFNIDHDPLCPRDVDNVMWKQGIAPEVFKKTGAIDGGVMPFQTDRMYPTATEWIKQAVINEEVMEVLPPKVAFDCALDQTDKKINRIKMLERSTLKKFDPENVDERLRTYSDGERDGKITKVMWASTNGGWDVFKDYIKENQKRISDMGFELSYSAAFEGVEVQHPIYGKIGMSMNDIGENSVYATITGENYDWKAKFKLDDELTTDPRGTLSRYPTLGGFAYLKRFAANLESGEKYRHLVHNPNSCIPADRLIEMRRMPVNIAIGNEILEKSKEKVINDYVKFVTA